MHNSQTDINAYLRSVTTAGAIQGYPPSVLAAGTDYGDAFAVGGAKSCVLTVSTGTAGGGPTAQSSTVSLQSAPAGTADGGTWADVPNTSVALTADEKAGSLGLNLMRLPSGHALLRCKVVTAFTGGSSPKQSVAATVTLGGFSVLPA